MLAGGPDGCAATFKSRQPATSVSSTEPPADTAAVAAQLRVEAEASSRPVQLYHLRSQRGEHEIDLIAEFGNQLAAFEVKSASAPTLRDARHLAWLRDQLSPGQFAGGVVFHTGRHRRNLGESIEAVPIAALWG